MCASHVKLFGLLLLALPVRAAERPLLGASVYGALGGFAEPKAQLAKLTAAGFRLVSFVPTYPYVDSDRIDFSGGPSWQNLENAVGLALSSGFSVILKPHLDPPAYVTGYKPPKGAKLGGHAGASWRGSFELDPMCEDYSEGLILRSLEMLQAVFYRQMSSAAPVRLELGAELLTSEVSHPQRWAELLEFARRERKRLGLEGRVLFSHNFAHHFEIAKDEVGRLTPEGRKALARYIKGLDGLALSQYMDLTIAVPAAERETRRPMPEEIARALVLHEQAFRRDILEGALGLTTTEIPPLHIGEFGVGSGGLKAPNLWAELGTPEREKKLAEEIALGHQGLARYLAGSAGRTALDAVLWDVGPHYDVFGWANASQAIPAAAAADRAYLSGR